MKDMLPKHALLKDENTSSSITAVILTLNEELHLARCLDSARQVASRIVVIDSFSDDRTVDIARDFGAEVHKRAFLNQAEQLQWALDACDLGTGWILRLDADEYLEPALIHEIRDRLSSLPDAITGVYLKRKLIFRDRWIRFGGYYPTRLLRLWRVGNAKVPPTWMDEHTILKEGHSVTFTHDFCDHSLKDITHWTEKHNRYATRKMVDFIAREYRLLDQNTTTSALTWQRAFRNAVFRRTPLFLRSLLYFLYRYIIRLGFLDGGNGLLWHGLQGFWYHLLTDAKIAEARTHIRKHGIDSFKAHLKQRHGIAL